MFDRLSGLINSKSKGLEAGDDGRIQGHVDQKIVVYPANSLSDVKAVMEQEIKDTIPEGGDLRDDRMWELAMFGGQWNPQEIKSSVDRELIEIHTHPLQERYRNKPMVKFLVDRYGLSFEEALVLPSRQDLFQHLLFNHKLNEIAQKMGAEPLNTYQSVTGTVLVDKQGKALLAAMLPLSYISNKDKAADKFKAVIIKSMDEIRNVSETQSTIEEFYDLVVGNTLTRDDQTKFLFGLGKMTHLMVPRFAFGFLDKEIGMELREKGDLDGIPRMVVGKNKQGELYTVLNIDYATKGRSYTTEYMALPLEEVGYNKRVKDALAEVLFGDNRDLSRKEVKEGLNNFIDSHKKILRPLEIGGQQLDVLPNRFVPNGQGEVVFMEPHLIGTPHSYSLTEGTMYYAASRNSAKFDNDSA